MWISHPLNSSSDQLTFKQPFGLCFFIVSDALGTATHPYRACDNFMRQKRLSLWQMHCEHRTRLSSLPQPVYNLSLQC